MCLESLIVTLLTEKIASAAIEELNRLQLRPSLRRISLPPINVLKNRSNLSGITHSPEIKSLVFILDGNFNLSIFKIAIRKVKAPYQ